MKLIKPILIAAIALLPEFIHAADLSGGNTITGGFSSANGYLNSIPGVYDWASGYGHTVNGNFNSVFGFQNTAIAGNYGSIFINGAQNTIGGYGNAVFGNLNQSTNNSQVSLITGISQTVGSASAGTGVLSWVGGQSNSVTGNQTLVYGSFLSDGGVNGSVVLSDNNPFGLRSAAARFTSLTPHSFTAVFTNGYFLSTNDGQGANPDAGLFVLPTPINSATTSNPAFVGINTLTPEVPLDVVGSAEIPVTGASSYFNASSTTLTQTNTGLAVPYSIRASAGVLALYFVANSDERIKRIQGRSDSAADLRNLRGIEVTDFLYKDSVEKDSRAQKKVIAQQVEKVFPQAVSTSTGVVPDIYKKATMKNGWVELATDLKEGDRVRLIAEKGKQGVHEVLEVKNGKFRTDFAADGDAVFVYGREVKDFRGVDYEAIAMLNVSATQELARKVDEKDAEIARLAAKLAALEARDQAREARLARLEAAASAPAARAVPAALELTTLGR